MKKLLWQSYESRERIIIFYMDRQHRVTGRYIRVLEMHDESLLAYCYFRKEVRSFRIENILSAGTAGRRVGA